MSPRLEREATDRHRGDEPCGGEDDEEFTSPAGSDPEVHRVRRSISTHPRFLASVEREHSFDTPAMPRLVTQLWDAVARRSSDRGQYEPLTERT